MSLRTDHPDWPTLTSGTLENPKRAGRNWVCTCPVCHTHHLNVDRRTGLFKCWYIGCEFRGILADKRLPREPRPSSAGSGFGNSRQVRTDDGNLWSCSNGDPDGEACWQPLDEPHH